MQGHHEKFNNSGKPLATMDDLIAVEMDCEQNNNNNSGDLLRQRGSKNNNNDALLEPNQVFHIMTALQEEQQRSTELMDTIRSEHKKAVSLRRLVAGLTVFVVLLAVANIGTSFVAARLAQDIRTSANRDLTNTAGERLGMTSKEVEVSMRSIADINGQLRLEHGSARHRHLQDAANLVCGDDNNCSLQGMMKMDDVVALYRNFCPLWPNAENVCKGEGVNHLNLNCNGVRSTIHGGIWLPPAGPALDTYSWSWMMFPNDQQAFFATEIIFDPFLGRFQEPCELPYRLTLACETNLNDCAVFASFDVDACPGSAPSICGDPGDASV